MFSIYIEAKKKETSIKTNILSNYNIELNIVYELPLRIFVLAAKKSIFTVKFEFGGARDWGV
jgi:hypothetical protein